jgi:hypothetical protein
MNLSDTHENLQQKYADLGLEVASRLLSSDDVEHAYRAGWALLCAEGFGKLFIAKQPVENNAVLNDGIVAIQGLSSTCRERKFLSFLIDQLSVIYFITQFGTKEQQKNYMPILINGGTGDIYFDESFHAHINMEFLDKTGRENPEHMRLMFCDILKFKQLLYSILVSSCSSSTNNKCMKLLNTSDHDSLRKDAN